MVKPKWEGNVAWDIPHRCKKCGKVHYVSGFFWDAPGDWDYWEVSLSDFRDPDVELIWKSGVGGSPVCLHCGGELQIEEDYEDSIP